MKYVFLATVLALASLALALDGQIGIHDPSTVVMCDGKYYTFGTGGAALVSDDGWTWRAGTRASRSGMAPDLIHVGDRYYQYIARNVGAQPKAEINMIWSKSLDPNSADYKWEEGGVVVSTDGIEDCNGIDPGALLDPNDGRIWRTCAWLQVPTRLRYGGSTARSSSAFSAIARPSSTMASPSVLRLRRGRTSCAPP